MKPYGWLRTAAIVASAMVWQAGPANATVTAAFSAGSACGGATSAQFAPGGAAITVALCVSTTTEQLCNSTIQPIAGAGQSGLFQITNRVVPATGLTDPTTSFPPAVYPVPINNPVNTTDFGSSVPAVPIAGGSNILLATFTIAPQAGATGGSYTIGLGGLSAIGVPSTPGDCGTSADVALNGLATFTFFQPSTASIAVAPASVPDDGTPLVYTVTLSPPPASTTLVGVTSLVSGTMTGQANTCTGTVSVSTGGTGTCTIAATNTVPFDGPATATVNVVAGAGYVLGAPASAQGPITNNDVPTVSIAASPASIFDSAGNVSTVTVTSSAAAPGGGLTVNLTPPAVSSRYTSNCGSSLTITAGNLTATCTVTATPNVTVGDGNVTATVAIAAGAYTIGTNPAVVTIQDDDIPVMSAVCTPTTLTDSAGQVSTCTISSDKALAAAITVNLTPPVANARYTSTCVSTISIPIGGAGTANTCTITAVANTTVGDGNATASLSVIAGAGYTAGGSTQNVAINNDDFASISVAVSPASVAEDSGTPLVYTFTASAASTSATSILFTPPAASGRYSTDCTSPITLPASATTVSCSVTPIGNGALDGSVTATVTVLPSAGAYTVGAPAVATGTITDNEIGISVTRISDATEGGSPGLFRVCRTGSTAAQQIVSFTLGGNAVQGADYTLSGNSGSTVVIAVGAGCADLGVTVVNDKVVNGSRTVTIALSAGEGTQLVPGQGSAVMVLIDEDQPTTIPTLSTYGLMLLSLLLAAAAGFSARRRRR